ncbi:MAG: carbohydrate binding domain-containing protein [Clostridia bacterium]|nr:carbohydrate binding domain-containing protein [Clostridia bacterium]
MTRKINLNMVKKLGAIALAGMLVLTGCARSDPEDEGNNMNSLFLNSKFDESTEELTGWTTWSSNELAVFSVAKKAGPDGSNCLKIDSFAADNAVCFQNLKITHDASYTIEADVKYDTGESGEGVLIGYTGYDASDNWKDEKVSPRGVNIGKSDGWEHLSFSFSVTTDFSRISAGVRLWNSSGTLLVDNLVMYENNVTEESRTYSLKLTDTPNRHKVDAFGAEWDPKFFVSFNTDRGVTEEEFAMIKERIRKLGIARVRMMILPEWLEPQNDNDAPDTADPSGFTMDNPEMYCVRRYLEACEELGVKVTLTWWGASVYSGGWLGYNDVNDWISAPNSFPEMAENIAYLINYARSEWKLSCITDVILQNEGSYSFREGKDVPVSVEHYCDYVRTVRTKLDREGLSDITLVGSDDAEHYDWYLKNVQGLTGTVGKFDSHNYAWDVKDHALDSSIRDFLQPRIKLAGDTPFFMGEFGDGHSQGAYMVTNADSFGRGLYIASFAVNALKLGAAGALYWPLHNVYYYYSGNPDDGSNGGLMMMGLFAFKNEEWKPRPVYYSWGMVCNTAVPGSEVYDITGDTDHFCDAVAVKSPAGAWSFMLVNRSSKPQTLKITAPAIGSASMDLYCFSESTLPSDDSMIAPSGSVKPSGGVYTVEIPGDSFIVLK